MTQIFLSHSYPHDIFLYYIRVSREQNGGPRGIFMIHYTESMTGFLVFDCTPWRNMLLVCLFDLILYVPSTIFQLNRDRASWV